MSHRFDPSCWVSKVSLGVSANWKGARVLLEAEPSSFGRGDPVAVSKRTSTKVERSSVVFHPVVHRGTRPSLKSKSYDLVQVGFPRFCVLMRYVHVLSSN